MNKKLLKTLTAVACAAVMSAQMAAIPASALNLTQSHYYYYNGIYYSDVNDAIAAAGTAGGWVTVYPQDVPTSSIEKYYDSVTGVMYDSVEAALAATGRHPSTIFIANYSTSTTGRYYSSLTGKYYSTYSAALAASNGVAKYVTYIPAATGYYYSSYTGKYYSTYAAALTASKGNSNYITYVGSTYSSVGSLYYSSVTNGYYSTYAAALLASQNSDSKVKEVKIGDINSGMYYSYVTGAYYSSYAYALTASDGDSSKVTFVGYNFFGTANLPSGSYVPNYYYTDSYRYYYNGTYYTSLADAIAAGGKGLGIDISMVPYYSYYYNGYYYNGYYGYADGYLAYLKDFFNKKETAAEDGEPYIYGRKSKAGWNTIISYIKSAGKGDTITVDMNGATIIDKSVLKVLDGKNVNVTFVLDNGAKWTINGKDIVSPKDINIYTEYNLDYISDSLVKKATNGAVSSAEIGISTTFDSFDLESSVTVKFSKKRAGLTAVVYRYNKDRNSLVCVDKAKIQSDGSCTFSVEAGGPYLIVLK